MSAVGQVDAAEQSEKMRAEDLPLNRRIIALGFVLTGYFFYAWSFNTVDILRPYIKESLQLSMEQAGSLYSLQAIGALVGAVINGQLADRFGRRNALVLVMVGFGLSLALGAVVSTYWQVAVQRVALGYFAGSMFPITVGLYSGLFSVGIRGRIAGAVMFTYNMGVSALGFVGRELFKAEMDWRLLLWTGLVPAALALLAFLLVPDDRKMTPYGVSESKALGAGAARFPVMEIFARPVIRQTVLLICMIGLNFFAYQAFTGWATTFLRDVRQFSDADIGSAVGWQFLGAAAGGFFWGWIGDLFGRKASAVGFFGAAALVLVYLFAPLTPLTLYVVAFLYGLVLSCSVVWGPWLAELYPPHLRSTAASIFNMSRIISISAPFVTAAFSHAFGLGATMALAAPCFILSAMIWLSLPETVRKG
jgi:MFS family permease